MFEGCSLSHRQLMTLRTNLCLLSVTLGYAFSSYSPFFNLFSFSFLYFLSISYRDKDAIVKVFFPFFSCMLFFFLSKKSIKGTMVFLPSPYVLLSHNISCDSVGPLTMLLLDMVTDEIAKSESLALGFRLWVVSSRRLC